MYFPAVLPPDRLRLENGWCCYPAVGQGDISECMKNYSRGKALGDCGFCAHFIPDQRGLQLKILKERRHEVDNSCGYLIQMIDLVRHGNGAEEDISSALARLQNDGFKYASALVKKFGEEK